MSVKEQAELALIEENIQFDEEASIITFEYPIVGDISKLEDNWKQAIAIERKVKERLAKRGELLAYKDEMRGYLERGTFREISQEEQNAWEGPVNYISHHGVVKPSS